MNILEKVKEYKAVIFDMDGTLVNNIPYHKESWVQFLNQHEIAIELSEFEAQNHGTGPEMMRRFFGNHHSEQDIIRLWNIKEELYRQLYSKELQPILGLNSFLEFLKQQHIRIALATMGTKENIDFVLNGLAIKSYFEVIVAGDEVVNGKPNPEVYLKAAKKLNLVAKDCIAIEDSISGIKSAIDAGMEVIAITTSSTETYFKSMGLKYIIADFLQTSN